MEGAELIYSFILHLFIVMHILWIEIEMFYVNVNCYTNSFNIHFNWIGVKQINMK